MAGVKGKTGKYKKSKEHNANLSKALKGRKFTEEHIKKLSLAKIGIKHGHKTNNGKEAWNRGKPHTEEVKAKLKVSRAKQIMKPMSVEARRKLSDDRKGDKWYTWRGGITPINRSIRMSLEYKLWREAVFKRDEWTCVWCYKKGSELNADHIKPFAYYPELRFAIDNGRTLCVDCHKTTDTYGGKCKNDKGTI
jgi:hypothetical protein